MGFDRVYPFSAVIGQEQLKTALILNVINPRIGGVLIRGEKGTAKSTTVRALSELLPPLEVVWGCGFSCDPSEPEAFCPRCRSRTGVSSRSIRTPVVTLPLNATEDRVVGGIDFHAAVKKGVRKLQPGLLAEAHRGILYVDEINLLDDHIVDIILDAAAAGENRVEREGVSFSHPSRFMLVGTMNPEEGELRPQLLDRFGLCVDVSAETDPETRVALMVRREAFDGNPRKFFARFASQNDFAAQRILQGKERLAHVRFPSRLRGFAAELAMENAVAGHRADLALEQASRALCAHDLRQEVTSEDIAAVASMVMAHRTRHGAPPPPPPPKPEEEQNTGDENENSPENAPPDTDEENDGEGKSQPGDNRDEGQGEDPRDNSSGEHSVPRPPPEADDGEDGEDGETGGSEAIFEVGQTFKVKNFTAARDKVFRRGSGRRSRTRVSQRQGRYIRSTMTRSPGDIALDATLRAAAPHQEKRRKEEGGRRAVILKSSDIREKIREKRIGNFLLFIVDASGSMGARGRMTASKGAIMSLLLDAYQKRDRVAMVSFRKEEGYVNLPPTASVEMAGKLLSEMPVGGRTPLSAGLAKGHELLRNHLLLEPTSRPIVMIITDGKANRALGDLKPFEEAMAFAARMDRDGRSRFIVVDTEEEGLIRFGLAEELAGALGAEYFKIDELKSDRLLEIVKGSR